MFLAQRLVHQPLTRKPDSSEAVEHVYPTHRFDKLKERSAVRCDVLFAGSFSTKAKDNG